MAHDSGYARRFLGLLVKQAREEKEWDQQYLADELDIDIRSAIESIEMMNSRSSQISIKTALTTLKGITGTVEFAAAVAGIAQFVMGVI